MQVCEDNFAHFPFFVANNFTFSYNFPFSLLITEIAGGGFWARWGDGEQGKGQDGRGRNQVDMMISEITCKFDGDLIETMTSRDASTLHHMIVVAWVTLAASVVKYFRQNFMFFVVCLFVLFFSFSVCLFVVAWGLVKIQNPRLWVGWMYSLHTHSDPQRCKELLPDLTMHKTAIVVSGFTFHYSKIAIIQLSWWKWSSMPRLRK